MNVVKLGYADRGKAKGGKQLTLTKQMYARYGCKEPSKLSQSVFRRLPEPHEKRFPNLFNMFAVKRGIVTAGRMLPGRFLRG
jgi:hypothetical protein